MSLAGARKQLRWSWIADRIRETVPGGRTSNGKCYFIMMMMMMMIIIIIIVSVLVQRYNAVLLHDTLPATDCTD